MNLLLQRFASRKFLIVLLVVLLSSLFLGLKLISESVWMQAVMTCLSVYVAGNVVQKWSPLYVESKDLVESANKKLGG